MKVGRARDKQRWLANATPSGTDADHPAPDAPRAAAFTLLEVMIALAIFFMAVFAILDSTSQSLSAARLLQQKEAMPDARFLLADLWPTNKLEEGIVEGDFGDLYPDFTWTQETTLVGTNGLFQVDFTIQGVVGKRRLESKASVKLWAPDSQVSSFRRQL